MTVCAPIALLPALVMARAFFGARWLGQSLKLAVLASRVLKVARRFFGVPEFHYDALADGIAFLLSRLRPRTKPPVPTPTRQLSLFHFI